LVDFIVDRRGCSGAGPTSGYAPLTPARVLDTRDGTGIGGQRQVLPPGGATAVVVAGTTGVPRDATGVMLNLTATEEADDGYLTVFPCGFPIPPSSNLNYRAGRDVANQVVAGIGAGGQICITSFATSHVVVDVLGWFSPSAPAGYVPLPPSRVLDTRQANPVFTGVVPARGVVTLPVRGEGGVPTSGASAVVLNVTVDGPAGPGFVTVFPCGGGPPLASNLNYAAGQVVANLTSAPAGNGAVCIFTWAPTHLVADVSGYFTG
jgi:hypothetical protein